MRAINSTINEILNYSRHIAIVGISNKPYRASFDIAQYLLEAGFIIYPVNPAYDSVLGLKCYNRLSEINHKVDIVNIFRRSSEVKPFIDEAISIKARAIWMQTGVINNDAAQTALQSGLDVVMDRCIKVEHFYTA